MLVAWISLTLSRHFSLSFIASGRSSGLHVQYYFWTTCSILLAAFLCNCRLASSPAVLLESM